MVAELAEDKPAAGMPDMGGMGGIGGMGMGMWFAPQHPLQKSPASSRAFSFGIACRHRRSFRRRGSIRRRQRHSPSGEVPGPRFRAADGIRPAPLPVGGACRGEPPAILPFGTR